MSCATGDRYGIYAARFSERGRWDAYALHQGDGTLRSKKKGGIAPFQLLNPMPVSKYGCLENFESNLRCFYNEIVPRTALLRCINNKIV